MDVNYRLSDGFFEFLWQIRVLNYFLNIQVFQSQDWVYHLDDERSSSFEHSHVDVLSTSCMELCLYFFFGYFWVEQV